MTDQERIILYKSKFWESLEPLEIVKFQLWEDKLCMPFFILQQALSQVLKRQIPLNEFTENRNGLRQEVVASGHRAYRA